MLKVVVQTGDRDFVMSLWENQPDDVQCVQDLLKSFPASTDQILNFALSAGSSVVVGLFTSWLYDKLKAKPQAAVAVNGIQINGDVTIIQLQYIIKGKNPQGAIPEEQVAGKGIQGGRVQALDKP